MDRELSRRNFVKDSLLSSAGLGLTLGAAGMAGSARGEEKGASVAKVPAAKEMLPTGKIGDLQITRLILGGNLLGRYNHIRDLRYVEQLVKRYNTDEKILETLALAEAQGINTLSVNISPDICRVLKEHREKRGGKIQWILYSTGAIEDPAKYGRDIEQMIDDGAEAIYIWGVHTDNYVSQGKLSVIGKAVEMVKSHGILCGIGAHDLRVVQECEKNKIPADFYIKTLHHLNYPSAKMDYDSIWCRNPQETIEFMKTVQKPWIAFKVMAAGAIPPKDAFQYAIEGGADFVLAGMFDFDVAEDVRVMRDVLAANPKRVRPWRS